MGHQNLDAQMENLSQEEMIELVREALKIRNGDLTAADIALYGELQGLVDFIRAARQEISSLKPNDICSYHIPSATDELDAIVEATAEATGGILDAAENLEEIAVRATPEICDEITNVVTSIYEACNFQDITGQRITKVVQTLKAIEEKVGKLMESFSHPAVADIQEIRSEKRVGEAALLNGPALPSSSRDQADIDAIFSS